MTAVVVVDDLAAEERNLDVERAILGDDVDLRHYAFGGDVASLIAACRNADAILTDYVPFTRDVIEQLSQCRVISVAATGYDSIDTDAAADAGISVCAIDEYCTNEVADHSILMMLTLCRRLLEYHDQVQTEQRWQFDSLAGLRSMRDMTLGIVGFGKIGQAVARRARGFAMTTRVYDPYEDSAIGADLGVQYSDLATIYAEADIISLHCNLSPDSEHLINSDAFACMQKRPILINCARGGLIDENALLQAFDSGQIAGAALDVLNDESPNLEASGLLGRPNVLLTPHVAFYSDASMLENREVSAANIRHCLNGEHTLVRKYVYHAAE